MSEDNDIYNDIMRCCDKACEIEEKLHDSLLSFSSRLLSCISILSVALVAGLGIERNGDALQLDPLWLLEMVGVFLAASFLTALVAQWRFQIQVPASPLVDIEQDYKDRKIDTKAESADYYVASLSIYHESLAKRNKKIRRLLHCSLLMLFVAVVLTIAWVALHCI